MSNRHLLIISVPGFHRHISCTSLGSSSFPLFHSLCLTDSSFVNIHPCFPVKILSMIVLIRSRHSSLSGFDALPMGSQRRTTRTFSSVSVSFNVRRQNVESSQAEPPALFQPQSLTIGVPLLLCLLWPSSTTSILGATICHGVPHKPSQFVDSQASLSVCLVQLLPCTTPFLVVHKNCSCTIMMTDKDSLSHASCK